MRVSECQSVRGGRQTVSSIFTIKRESTKSNPHPQTTNSHQAIQKVISSLMEMLP